MVKFHANIIVLTTETTLTYHECLRYAGNKFITTVAKLTEMHK